MVDGSHSKTIELPNELFHGDINKRLIAQYVRVYLYNQKEYNASTKTRGEVVGSTRKIYRQKGTGRARHGSIKAPIFVGGGVVFGPKPKNVSLQMNQNQKRKALIASLSQKALEGAVLCFSDEVLRIKSKTREVKSFFDKINISDKKKLVVTHNDEKNTFNLGARNLENVSIVDVGAINPYIILNSDQVAFTESSIEILKKKLIS